MEELFLKEAKHGLAALKERFQREADEVEKLHFSGAGGMVVVSAYTGLMDRIVTTVFLDAVRRMGGRKDGAGLSLAAVGGYGRGELNPRSDVDILFLCSDCKTGDGGRGGSSTGDDVTTAALHMLWDLGLDLGYSVRSVGDCCQMADGDYTVMTALLETRYLSGDRKLLSELSAKLAGQRRPKVVEEYIRQKLADRVVRRKKHGESVYLREPNIKEGAGGLRDIHTALWISKFKYGIDTLDELALKGFAKPSEIRRLKGTRDYLLRLRNELHYLSAHKQDVLTFELQEKAAADFGYTHRDGRMAVENFMRAYYLRARGVHDITQMIIENSLDRKAAKRWFFLPPQKKRLDDNFYVMGRALCMDDGAARSLAERPELFMAAFAHSQAQGLPMSENLSLNLSEHTRVVVKKIGGSREAASTFLDILGRSERVFDMLEHMHRIGFLGRYIPEFGAVSALVQHDLYHKYTVDEHSLLAVKKIQSLGGPDGVAFPEFVDALGRVKDRPALMLTVLMHDTGKAVGGGHADRGAALAHGAALRLGMEDKRAELVEFLVRNHLLMAHLSQRRELSDTVVLEKFCRIVDTRERLDMLFLLTYADMSAVGPEVFNQWRRTLLRELYGRAAAYLEDKGSVVAYEKKLVAAKTAAVCAEVARMGLGKEAEVRKFIANLPPRYLLSVPEDTVVNHFRLTRDIKPGDVVVHHEHDDGGFTNLTIILHDALGLFYLSAGALAARNMNILSANIFTGRDGLVVDTLQVTDVNKNQATDEALWSAVTDGLVKALRGQARVDELMPARPAYPKRTSLTSRPPRVVVDNEASDRYTVVEVYTHDRVGLLHDITRTLYTLGCYISSAKVDTDVDRVVDVFYVSDIFKDKVWDPEKLKGIKDAIAYAVSGRGR
ncbi:MAG TPA: [protein-PII] uridylyltransferase [Nitrospirota bacterium]